MRVFRWYSRAGDAIQYDTRVKDASEVVSYLFDFSQSPEVKAGETLSAPALTATAGITAGTPAVTAAARDGVAAGQGVAVTLSGGTAGNSYNLEMKATTSGGSERVVKGLLKVE